MCKSKTKKAKQRFNTVALQNWDTTQQLVGFFFTHTAKAIERNTHKLKQAVATLSPAQQKELSLAIQMNEALSVLSSKFTPEQILSAIAFLEHSYSLEYLFTKEDIERMEASCV